MPHTKKIHCIKSYDMPQVILEQVICFCFLKYTLWYVKTKCMNIYYHCAKYQICFQKCRYMTFFRLNHWTISKLPVCIFSSIFCIIFVLLLGSDIFFVYNGPIICNSGGGGICFCFLKNTLLVLADKNISALVYLVH